jgi:hypothetical protein
MRGQHESVQTGIDPELAAERRLKVYEALYLLGVKSFSFYTVCDGRSIECRISANGAWHDPWDHGLYTMSMPRGNHNSTELYPRYDLMTDRKYTDRLRGGAVLLTGDGLDEGQESAPLSTVAGLLAELDGLMPYEAECWVDLPTPDEIANEYKRLAELAPEQSVTAAAGYLALSGS